MKSQSNCGATAQIATCCLYAAVPCPPMYLERPPHVVRNNRVFGLPLRHLVRLRAQQVDELRRASDEEVARVGGKAEVGGEVLGGHRSQCAWKGGREEEGGGGGAGSAHGHWRWLLPGRGATPAPNVTPAAPRSALTFRKAEIIARPLRGKEARSRQTSAAHAHT